MPQHIPKFSRMDDLIALGLILLPLAYGAFMLQEWPNRVAVHFNMRGEPDGWGSPHVLIWPMGGINLFTYFLLRYMPTLDLGDALRMPPGQAYRAVVLGTVVFTTILHMVMLLTIQRPGIPIPTVVGMVLCGSFLLIGNYLPALRKNHLIGIRTPWTLGSDRVWQRTHQWAGRWLSVAAAVGIGLLLVWPSQFLLAVGLPVGMALASVGYSWWVHQQLRQAQR